MLQVAAHGLDHLPGVSSPLPPQENTKGHAQSEWTIMQWFQQQPRKTFTGSAVSVGCHNQQLSVPAVVVPSASHRSILK